jgi:AraC-like DNA-binding protein
MSFTRSEENSFLTRLAEITEANLTDERFGVSELAREMGMSRSNLHRKLIAAKGISISTYIRQFRLEKAMELLKQSSSTISEIAFQVGFNSVTYFSKCFHDHFGYAAGEVRKGENENPKSDEIPKTPKKASFRGKRVSLTFLLLILGLIIAAAILIIWIDSFESKGLPQDKSIAVLPFINDSPEETEMYFINGTMEAILHNLCKIEDLHVVSRNSVEQ